MSENILLSEYRARLASAGALWCCDPRDAGASPDSREWTAPLGSLRASIRLEGGPRGLLYMQPRCVAAGTVAGTGFEVAVVLADAMATMQRANSALVSLGDVRVWLADCPCGHCSATGKTQGSACKVCNGTGKRQEPTP